MVIWKRNPLAPRVRYMVISPGRVQTEHTIGPYGSLEHEFTLSRAREERDRIVEALARGELPSRSGPPSKRQETAEIPQVAKPSFGEFAISYVNEIESEFRNPKHRAQWHSTLRRYCEPIWDLPIDEVGIDQILAILSPIWNAKQETASRVRGRIERVLDAATVRRLRTGDNPARWQNTLRLLLPRRRKLQRGHHTALPYDELPDLWRRLQRLQSVSARALQFVILTCVWLGEALGATWDEIDFENRVWQIPAHRMKANRPHRVPLTENSLRILKEMRSIQISDYIFPGHRDGRPISHAAILKQAKAYREELTVHGFRSSFRDWAGEETDHAREVVEWPAAGFMDIELRCSS